MLAKSSKNIWILPWKNLQCNEWTEIFIYFSCANFSQYMWCSCLILQRYAACFVQILSELWNEKIPAKISRIFKLEINMNIIVRKKSRAHVLYVLLFFYLHFWLTVFAFLNVPAFPFEQLTYRFRILEKWVGF